MLAQALETPFELSQPAGQVLAVVLFLIPALNCTWIIERLAGRTPLSGTERLFRAIAWSLAGRLGTARGVVQGPVEAADPNRLSSELLGCRVLFAGPLLCPAKLRTGERIGGLFASSSFASAYPEPQDIYLEQAWQLTEDGTLDEPVPGSRGLLLRQDDVEVLEFIELQVADGD
jgi:hypothetical protein